MKRSLKMLMAGVEPALPETAARAKVSAARMAVQPAQLRAVWQLCRQKRLQCRCNAAQQAEQRAAQVLAAARPTSPPRTPKVKKKQNSRPYVLNMTIPAKARLHRLAGCKIGEAGFTAFTRFHATQNCTRKDLRSGQQSWDIQSKMRKSDFSGSRKAPIPASEAAARESHFR